MNKEQARNIIFRQLVDNMLLASKPYVYQPLKKQKRGKGKSGC